MGRHSTGNLYPLSYFFGKLAAESMGIVYKPSMSCYLLIFFSKQNLDCLDIVCNLLRLEHNLPTTTKTFAQGTQHNLMFHTIQVHFFCLKLVGKLPTNQVVGAPDFHYFFSTASKPMSWLQKLWKLPTNPIRIATFQSSFSKQSLELPGYAMQFSQIRAQLSFNHWCIDTTQLDVLHNISPHFFLATCQIAYEPSSRFSRLPLFIFSLVFKLMNWLQNLWKFPTNPVQVYSGYLQQLLLTQRFSLGAEGKYRGYLLYYVQYYT